MRRFRDLPIGRKLVVVGAAASALALVVSSAIFLLSTFFALRDSVQKQLEVQSAIVADNTAAPLAFDDRAAALETVSTLRVTDYVDMACIFDAGGRLFANYSAAPGADVCPAAPPAVSAVPRGLILRPIIANGNRYGTLLMKGNFNQVWDRLPSQTVAALAGIVLGVAAAILLSATTQRLISGPILELSQTAARISQAGDYSLRATRQGADEVGELVDTFNGMVSEVARRDEQLRAASRLKDEFLATLSHELRTPLNAELGWIQVLRAAPADPALVARAYASIERNARAQTTLIEDLLDVSRIVTGKLRVTADSVDLTTVIEAALEVVRPAAEAKNLTVTRHFASMPLWVTGDAHRLQQVAWNLMSNAVKFTSQGGHINVWLRAESANYVFEVVDDGIGLRADFLPHVFDRFRQGDGSMTRPHGGLGLGLAIARELTELHGGRIAVSSRGVGRGATFTVSLPKQVSQPTTLPAGPKTLDERLDGLSVLVVDDDEDTRELARVVVSNAGAEPVIAGSAPEALQVLGARDVDVVLCDLAMPGIDGYELIGLIRSNEKSQARPRIPAIAVSAHAGAGAAAKALASGFDGFVAKPYALDSLVAAIIEARATRSV
ncbi:MAG: ATP-binding protein [Acidobacteriota bacterium]